MSAQFLASQLAGVDPHVAKNAPESVVETLRQTRADLVASFSVDSGIQEGAKLPPFKLKNAVGKEVSSQDLLATSAILITFCRGGWCPYCNLALHSLQEHYDEFTAKGVTLVAIPPELPDESLSTTEKHELKFVVLSDLGNKYARELGIVWKQPDSLRPVFQTFGNDLKARNGDDSFELPVPTNLLVDQQGIVRNRYSEADWTKRIETTTMLKWVDALKGSSSS